MKSKTVWFVSQIIGTCIMIPMYFVKLMHEVGILPTEDGGTIEAHYYYSIYDKLGRDSYAVWIMIAIAVASIALYIISIARGGKFNKICITVFIAQIILFLFLLFIADIAYHYCY